jgi:hypothetical protein
MLDIYNNRIQTDGFRVLIASPVFQRLTELNVSQNSIGREAAQAIRDIRPGCRLRRLEIYDSPGSSLSGFVTRNRIESAALIGAIQNSHLRDTLEELDLVCPNRNADPVQNAGIDVSPLTALVANPLPRLQVLRIREEGGWHNTTEPEREAYRMLANSTQMGGVIRLTLPVEKEDLFGNLVRERGTWNQLQRLEHFEFK